MLRSSAAETGAVNVFYRGRVTGELPASSGLQLLALDSIPWEQLSDEAERAMLQRFVRERTEDAFGIYMGDAQSGSVKSLARV